MHIEILAEFRILLQNTWLPRHNFKIRFLRPRGGDSSDCSLLGFDTMWCSSRTVMFHKFMLPLPSGLKELGPSWYWND